MPYFDNSKEGKTIAKFCENLDKNEIQLINEILERFPEKSFNWDDFKNEQQNNGIVPKEKTLEIIDFMQKHLKMETLI